MRGSLILSAFLAAATAARAEVSWVPLLGLPTARSALAAASLNGLFYAIGGSAPAITGAVERYDPASAAWSAVAALTTPRYYLAAAVAGGKIYAIGGYNGVHVSTVEAYDPATNAWNSRAALLTPRSRLGAAALNGIVYAVGGNNGGYLLTNESYDPTANAWTTRGSLNFACQNPGVAAVGGKVYAAGGYNGTYTSNMQAYDPGLNYWTYQASMPTARSSLALIVAQGRLYAVGGTNGTNLATVEEYDPATNTWASRRSLTTARMDLAGDSISDSLYIAGGYNGAYLSIGERGELVDPLALAADSTGLTWNTGGNATWFAESAVTHDGVDALQSGSIGNSQSSFIEAALTGPGSLTFYWMVSSEAGYDYLRFYIDGVEQAGKISGTGGTWALKQYQLTAGAHVLRWTYSKDASVSLGSDAGWVDEVTWTPAGQASGAFVAGPEGLMRASAPGVSLRPNVLDLSQSPRPVFHFDRGKANAKIAWTVFDGSGRAVRKGEAALDAAGNGAVTFDLLDDGGAGLAPGAYTVAVSGGELDGRRAPFLVVAKRAR